MFSGADFGRRGWILVSRNECWTPAPAGPRSLIEKVHNLSDSLPSKLAYFCRFHLPALTRHRETLRVLPWITLSRFEKSEPRA
jgi:hypothetical protein